MRSVRPTPTRFIRIACLVATALALVATLRINFYTLSQIPRAATRVPWWDEWDMVQQYALYEQGKPLWPIVWTPYWGHRLVIPRLIFFANLRWASRACLTWLTLTAQFAVIALLLWLAWILVGRTSLLRFAMAATVILSLMLSPFAMQNFVWSMQIIFPLVYATAAASFLCLSISSAPGRGIFLVLSIVAGWISSWTMPNGLAVWPALVAEAVYLKMSRRILIALALIGTVFVASYSWHYERQPMGMGADGMLRQPLRAVKLTGLLLSGSLSYVSRPWGIAVALAALAGVAYLCVRVLRHSEPRDRYLAVLAALILFVFLSAGGTVAGRLSAEWLRRSDLQLPSKYFMLIGTFWAAVAVLVLYANSRRQDRWIGVLYAPLFLCMMFLNLPRQLGAAGDWADFLRGVDAVGAAFLLNAPDDKFLWILWPNPQERDQRVAFLRQHHASIFAEPRALWPGRNVAEIFPPAAPGRCIGAIEKATDLPDSGPVESWRAQGWAWDTRTRRAPEDVLIADSAGRVVGLARGGFRHGYLPGFFTDPAAPAVSHSRFPESEWLGYVRQSGKTPWIAYAVLPREKQVCRIERGVP